MRIDLNTRLSLGFIIGWAVIIGEMLVGALGGPVNGTVVGTAGTVIVATITAGIVTGAANQRKEHNGQKG